MRPILFEIKSEDSGIAVIAGMKQNTLYAGCYDQTTEFVIYYDDFGADYTFSVDAVNIVVDLTDFVATHEQTESFRKNIENIVYQVVSHPSSKDKAIEKITALFALYVGL